MTICHILATFDISTYHFVKVSKAKRHFKQQQMVRKLISRTGTQTGTVEVQEIIFKMVDQH